MKPRITFRLWDGPTLLEAREATTEGSANNLLFFWAAWTVEAKAAALEAQGTLSETQELGLYRAEVRRSQGFIRTAIVQTYGVEQDDTNRAADIGGTVPPDRVRRMTYSSYISSGRLRQTPRPSTYPQNNPPS